ncbi:hypothetical protein [Tepidimonas sp.]|uniref:hypothetical protein n=1 Tax=Tepidimonas sp. TaxID=2002775 RepID=UPI00391D8DDC
MEFAGLLGPNQALISKGLRRVGHGWHGVTPRRPNQALISKGLRHTNLHGLRVKRPNVRTKP